MLGLFGFEWIRNSYNPCKTSEKLEMENFVVDTVEMTESHKSENITEKIDEVWDEWGISTKVKVVVTDNAADI